MQRAAKLEEYTFSTMHWKPLNLHKKHFILFLCGKKESGKTDSARWIVWHLTRMLHVREHMVLVGNDSARTAWAQLIHPLYITGMNLAELRMLCDSQDLRLRDMREAWVDAGNDMNTFVCPPRMRKIVVIDDPGDALESDKDFISLVTMHRHYGIDLVILGQYLPQLHKRVREQVDVVIMFKHLDESRVEMAYKTIMSMTGMSWAAFKDIFRHYTTGPGRALVMLKNTPTYNPEDMIRCFTCPHPIIWSKRLGSEALLRYAEKHYALSKYVRVLKSKAEQKGRAEPGREANGEKEEVEDANLGRVRIRTVGKGP